MCFNIFIIFYIIHKKKVCVYKSEERDFKYKYFLEYGPVYTKYTMLLYVKDTNAL